MNTLQVYEVDRVLRSILDAEKRINDALISVERIREELIEIHKAALILRDSFETPPMAEEAHVVWNIPSGPMA